MNWKQIKDELQLIISGKSSNSHDALIQTIANYLRNSEKTSPTSEAKHKNKAKEENQLIKFATDNKLIIESIDETKFISSGAEQRVYIKNNRKVIKLNDSIYFASWEDYFYNLLLHNYFFADTYYNFLGFHLSENKLHAVVDQMFIISDEQTELNNVKLFLETNGFINTKNHDYYHPNLGIILEDLHDENVLTNKGILYFIDTVFYIKPEIFWK